MTSEIHLSWYNYSCIPEESVMHVSSSVNASATIPTGVVSRIIYSYLVLRYMYQVIENS